MKPAPAGLQTLLSSGEFVFCDLYKFTLSTGQVQLYTTADVDIIFGGQTYSSALFFDQLGSKAVCHWKVGFDVDTWQVHIMPVDIDPVTGTPFPITIGSTPWLAAVSGGALDGAVVDIHRAFFTAWPQPWTSPFSADAFGLVLVDYFAGRVAAVDLMRTQAIVSINSWMDQFGLLMPRNLWQAPCRFTLFDSGCQLSQAANAHNYTLAAGSNQTSLVVNAGFAAPSFSLGQAVMATGLNAGFRRMITAYDGATAFLRAPFPFAINPGETVTMYQGCDKTLNGANGCAGWANTINFGGEDLIPAPETAV